MKEIFAQQIAEGIAAMKEWKKDDLSVVFPIITDLHSNLIGTDPLISMRRYVADHLECWVKAAEEAGADFAADLGDDGLDVPLKTEEEGQKLIDQMESFYRTSSTPVIHCVGNHDISLSEKWNGRFWGDWLKKVNDGKLNYCAGSDGSYGYFDLPEKGCRVFFLNTSDGKTLEISPEQLEFIDEHLWELTKKQTAIFLTHICPLTRCMWQHPNVTIKTPYRFPEFCMKLQEFVEAGGNIAGVFSGNSHANFYDYESSVGYFVSQGYGGCSTITEKPQQMTVFHQYCEALKRTDTFNSDEYCLLDLVVIKPLKREVRIFRIGAGGFEFHRGAKY